MTDAELETIGRMIDRRLTAIEERLRKMVDERNTNVISAATALVSGLQDEMISLHEGLESLSANVAGRRLLIDADLRRFRERLDAVERTQREYQEQASAQRARMAETLHSIASHLGAPVPPRPVPDEEAA
jgi:hypothetical protein